MRELKFRAWDKDCRWFEHFEIGENDDCYGIFRATANKFGSAIEQYTGLKDKNGKEIYEGDIVSDQNGKLAKVFYDEGYSAYRLKWLDPPIADFLYWFDVDRVVGNIHENEDTREAEPLIKDDKTRKAVRAWAEAQGLTEVYCASSGYEIYGGVDDLVIQFKGEPFPFADKNRAYTITELCGEEGK